MDKGILQEHAQKARWPLPVYKTSNAGGPPHMPCFRSVVNVNGQAFTSAEYWPTIKAAEHAAARAALKAMEIPSVIRNAVMAADAGRMKSHLQLYCQQLGRAPPVYGMQQNSTALGAQFVASVTFGGMTFKGSPAFKKQKAEVSAAATALASLGWSKQPLLSFAVPLIHRNAWVDSSEEAGNKNPETPAPVTGAVVSISTVDARVGEKRGHEDSGTDCSEEDVTEQPRSNRQRTAATAVI